MIDGGMLQLGPRTLLWAFSDQSHVLISESPDFDMWVFVFARETLSPTGLCPPPTAAEAAEKAGAFVLPLEHHRELSQIAATVRDRPEDQWLTTGLRWWAMRAWESSSHASPANEVRTHPALQRALETMDARPDLDLAEVACQSGTSQSHLGALCRKEIGQSLSNYRTLSRLRFVDRVMMGEDRTSLLTAALDAGFGSYSQFFRSFVRFREENPRRFYASVDESGGLGRS